MTAYSIVLLLGMVVATTPTLGDIHEVQGRQPTDARADDEEQIGDDAGLITDEFSYTYLFDQSYGVLAGFGPSSPHHFMHVEGLAFLQERLAISMLVGYGMGHNFDTQKHDHTADTLAVSVKTRYYLPLLPVSVNTSCGYVFWKGDITFNESSDKHDYKSSAAYLGFSLSAYYFWKNGIYIESALYGLSFGKAFGLKTDTAAEDTVSADIEQVTHYGVFGGGQLTLTLGYMF